MVAAWSRYGIGQSLELYSDWPRAAEIAAGMTRSAGAERTTIVRGRLVFRALWWRRAASVTLLAVAVVTTGAAALGPIYARAAGESTLSDHLTQAASSASGINLRTEIEPGLPTAVRDATAQGLHAGDAVGYGKPIAALTVMANSGAVPSAGGLPIPVVGPVVSRTGICAHVMMLRGRCPTAPDEAMVSARTVAGRYGFTLDGSAVVGDVLVASTGSQGQEVLQPARLHVVGVYRPSSLGDPYWFGHGYFNAHQAPGQGLLDKPDTIDALFVAPTFFTSVNSPATVTLDLDYPLDPTKVRLNDEAELRAQISTLSNRYGPNATVRLTTGVIALLDAADRERDLLNVAAVLVTVQLALLAWFVLFQVVADTADARGNEIALAKLRGLSPRATVAFGLGEPILLLAVAIPLGLVFAYLGVFVMAHLFLVPGTPVVLSWAGLGGALTGFVGGVVAAALAARRTLTRPVLEQWRQTTHAHRSRPFGLLIDLAIAAAAIASVAVLVRHNSPTGTVPVRSSGIFLLGPALAVLGVALLGVRLLPFLARGSIGSTRGSPRVGSFLAVRQVLRRSAGLRLAALLAVAIGLAAFSIDAESVASANRAARARIEVGADRVVVAQFLPGTHDPQSAVRAADPAGHWAMAAATWLPSGGPVTGTVLAVDSARLAATAQWPQGNQGIASTTAAGLLRPAAAPGPVAFSGDALRVRISRLSVTPGPAPTVQLNFRSAASGPSSVTTQPLAAGTGDYSAAVPCSSGCELIGVLLNRPIDFFGPMNGNLLISSFEAESGGSWSPVHALLGTEGTWRAGLGVAGASADVTASAAGLHMSYTSTGGGAPAIEHADAPQPIPVVGTTAGVRRDSQAGPSILVDQQENTVSYTEVGTVPLLPQVVDNGAIVDLTYMRHQLADFDQEASWQVWLSPTAPPDAIQRLEHAGLLVDSVQNTAQREAQLARQGPSLALILLVVCAIAAAVLAAGATALAVAVTGRRRAFELAALRAVGLSRRGLLRSCVGEQLILLGTGFVLGLPAGLIAARLVLPAIPESSNSSPIPLSYAPQVVTIAIFVAAVAALLVLTAVVAGRGLMRAAVPDRLREAAP